MTNIDPMTYAQVQREARIAAEDRAVEAEARLREAINRIRELETLVMLYRPDRASQPEPVAEESPGTRVWGDS